MIVSNVCRDDFFGGRCKIWLTPVGKIQKDFEYIFSEIQIEGYIGNSDMEAGYRDASFLDFSEFRGDRDTVVIICDRKDERKKLYKTYIDNWGTCIYIEDLIKVLDYDLKDISAGRDVVLCTEISNELIAPQFLLDSKKYGNEFAGKVIVDPNRFEKWKECFVVVTVEEPVEIYNFLHDKGLEERKDYIWYKRINGIQLQENRKLVYFGCGNTAKKLISSQMIWKERGIKKYIHRNELKTCDKNRQYVIYTGKAYDKVEVLRARGFCSIKDFIHWDYMIKLEKMKPSELLRETMFAKCVNQPGCRQPFYYSYISRTGEVYGCCPGWPKLSFGNLRTQKCEEVWNSVYAKIFRLSLVNRTYCFCNTKSCGKLFPDSEISKDQNSRYAYDKTSTPMQVVPCIDYTCNLYCESCRKTLEIAKDEDLNEINYFTDCILDSQWLKKKADILQLSGYGEVFVSKVYQRLLYSDKNTCGEVQILSNGNLFTEGQFEKLIHRYGKIKVINISVDAASEKTYIKLRRGGNWEKLLKNLIYIGKRRREGLVDSFVINMTVQRDNFREIPEFIKLGKKIHADTIGILPIRNWGTYSDDEFKRISMISEKEDWVSDELKGVLRNELLKENEVEWEWFKQRMGDI